MIQSHCITKSDYGIVTLIINTIDKWVDYTCIDSVTNFSLFINDKQELVIPRSEFEFDIDAEKHYHRLEQQNKDQITFYWIPVRLLKGDRFLDKIKGQTPS